MHSIQIVATALIAFLSGMNAGVFIDHVFELQHKQLILNVSRLLLSVHLLEVVIVS